MVLSDFNDFQNWFSISRGLDMVSSFFYATVERSVSIQVPSSPRTNAVLQLPCNASLAQFRSFDLWFPLRKMERCLINIAHRTVPTKMGRPLPGGPAHLHSVLVQGAFFSHLVGAVSRGIRVELGPARLAIEVASICNPNRGAVEHRLQARGVSVGHARADNGSAASQSFGIDISLVLADARLSECTERTAGRTSCGCSRQGRNQPAGGHDRTYTRNGEEAEPGQSTERAACDGANAGAGTGRFRTIILTIQIAVRECARLALLAVLLPFVSIASENADVAVFDAGCFEAIDCCLSVGITIVES